MTRPEDEADELWSAVADPTRRRILDALLTRDGATATALAGVLPITRQAVSKHLAVLERTGLVQARRLGREVRYTVRAERLDAATRSMNRVAAEWDKRLAAIKRIAEAAQREAPGSTGSKRGGRAKRQNETAKGTVAAHEEETWTSQPQPQPPGRA